MIQEIKLTKEQYLDFIKKIPHDVYFQCELEFNNGLFVLRFDDLFGDRSFSGFYEIVDFLPS